MRQGRRRIAAGGQQTRAANLRHDLLRPIAHIFSALGNQHDSRQVLQRIKCQAGQLALVRNARDIGEVFAQFAQSQRAARQVAQDEVIPPILQLVAAGRDRTVNRAYDVLRMHDRDRIAADDERLGALRDDMAQQ